MNTLPSFTEEGLKAQARKLKFFLDEKGLTLNYMGCLEAVARQYGHKSWQHLNAALPKNQSSLEAFSLEKAIQNILKEKLSQLIPGLSEITRGFSFYNGITESSIDFSEVVGGEDNLRCGRLSCKTLVDKDTTLELSIGVYYSNDFGNLKFDAEVSASLSRPGFGPKDMSGWREDMVDWGEVAPWNSLAISSTEADWEVKLKNFLKDVPLMRLVAEALNSSEPSTLRDVKETLSKRIEGMPAERLHYSE